MNVNAPLAMVFLLMASQAVLADDSRQRWWHGDWREAYELGHCEVEVESKPGEYKREVTCEDGIGATWYGEWETEFRDGNCEVKLEADRETFKEEVKCEDWD